MMWRRLLPLNVALLAVIVAGSLRVRQSWNEFESSHRVELIRAEAEAEKVLPGAPTIAAKPEDWTDISVKNPFSFDRNDVAIVAPVQAAPARPNPVLFGVMSIGSERIAMLAPGQSGSRASRPVKVGESLDTWQIVEIQEKAVIIAAANGTRQTIIMNDPTAQPPRSYERTGTGAPAAPVNIVTATPAAPTAPAASTSPAPTPPAAQPPTTGQPTGEMLITPFGPVPRTKP